jgi:PIN domain nuclease of toxin-antitoxin system
VKLLLDTHALIWWLIDAPELSAKASQLIAVESNEIFVSAASIWEIATKYRIGRLPNMGAFMADYSDEIEREGFEPLSISLRHAHLAGSLEGAHKDPFDRMLIAQALLEEMTLLSNESLFDGYGVMRIW